MKKLTFVRWGDLSPVNHKKIYKKDTYHTPPVKKGVYCFLPEYIEMFLVGWKFDKDYRKKWGVEREPEYKKFKYSGKLWTHLYFNHPEITYYRINKSWYETDTDSLEIILKIRYKERSKEIHQDKWLKFSDFNKSAINYFSKDEMEFYIERP